MTEDTVAKEAPAPESAPVEERFERSVAVVPPHLGIVVYSSRAEVRELALRIRVHPRAKGLQDWECWALSQSCLTMNLNYYAEEIDWIPVTGPYVRIAGRRRNAKEMNPDANYWVERRQVIDPQRRRELMIPDGAIAVEGWLRDSVMLFKIGEVVRSFVAAKAPWDKIEEFVGTKPYVGWGLGVVTKEEIDDLDNPRWWHSCKGKRKMLRGFDKCGECGERSTARPNKYPHISRADKRCEAACLRVVNRFPLPIVEDKDGQMLDDMIVEAQAIDLPEVKDAAWRPGGAAKTTQATKDALWQADDGSPNGPATAPLPPEPPPPPAQARVVIRAEEMRRTVNMLADRFEKRGIVAIDRDRQQVAAGLGSCFETDAEDQRHLAGLYLTGFESAKDMSAGQVLALKQLLEDWKAPEHVRITIQEAAILGHQVAGQQTLPAT